MHYVKAKSILSSKNGMNLYRGCSHGCIYCDSRSKCYHLDHDFEDIEIKENSIELLNNSLKRKRKKCMLGTGSMTDPYIPLEINFENVRKALSLAYQYDYGFTLITKSDLILRDLDLLKKINEKTKCVVQMTLTTYNEDLCKKIEPNVSTTKERFEVLKKIKGFRNTNCCLDLSYSSVYQRYRGKYIRHFRLLHRSQCLWCNFFRNGNDTTWRKSRIFL